GPRERNDGGGGSVLGIGASVADITPPSASSQHSNCNTILPLFHLGEMTARRLHSLMAVNNKQAEGWLTKRPSAPTPPSLFLQQLQLELSLHQMCSSLHERM
ncbi:hypothetical protein SK128_023250, partial [Halocaridina rubra]